MKILVHGASAMSGYYGARLIEAGATLKTAAAAGRFSGLATQTYTASTTLAVTASGVPQPIPRASSEFLYASVSRGRNGYAALQSRPEATTCAIRWSP